VTVFNHVVCEYLLHRNLDMPFGLDYVGTWVEFLQDNSWFLWFRLGKSKYLIDNYFKTLLKHAG